MAGRLPGKRRRSLQRLNPCRGTALGRSSWTRPWQGRSTSWQSAPPGRSPWSNAELAANPEIRSSVIGQVFAYAAGLWSLSYDEFDRLFTDRAGGSLGATVVKAADLEDRWDQHAFREAVTSNLETGQFDLVIAVDSIPEELKRVVR